MHLLTVTYTVCTVYSTILYRVCIRYRIRGGNGRGAVGAHSNADRAAGVTLSGAVFSQSSTADRLLLRASTRSLARLRAARLCSIAGA